MKKYFGIKLSLLGIGLIAFFPYAESFMNVSDQTFFGSVIAGFGAFSPLIGLILCISGIFVKDTDIKD